MGDLWIHVQMTFPESTLGVARGRVDELLALVKEKDDPKSTLDFEYFFDEETRTFVVLEHFSEPQGVLDHSEHIYEVGMSIFGNVESSQVELYGDVTDDVSKYLPGSPVYRFIGSGIHE